MRTILVILGLVGTAAHAQVANTSYGNNALNTATTGGGNSAFGDSPLNQNTNGRNNSAFGVLALYGNTSGTSNSSVGYGALEHNTTGNENTAFGTNALNTNGPGSSNLALGLDALYTNGNGNSNTALGYSALGLNRAGSNNIGVGNKAGYFILQSNNIDIGATGNKADSGVIRIGTAGTQKATYVAGVRGVKVTGGQAVVVSATGQLGISSTKILPAPPAALTEADIRRIVREELAAQRAAH